jgi:hypothetical protein
VIWVTTKLGTLFKIGLIAALLLVASSGAAYYYAVYLPVRDAQQNERRLAEALHVVGRQRADAARAVAEHQQQEQRLAADKAAAESRYETCLTGASTNHDAAWSEACKRLADQALEDRGNCLANKKLPQGYCNAAYRSRDASPRCILPANVATTIDGNLTIARNRCRQQRNAALQ